MYWMAVKILCTFSEVFAKPQNSIIKRHEHGAAPAYSPTLCATRKLSSESRPIRVKFPFASLAPFMKIISNINAHRPCASA
jgi:hypothetical protein